MTIILRLATFVLLSYGASGLLELYVNKGSVSVQMMSGQPLIDYTAGFGQYIGISGLDPAPKNDDRIKMFAIVMYLVAIGAALGCLMLTNKLYLRRDSLQ